MEEDDVYEFLGTQPVPRPLAGVIAFIDVRSSDGGAENRGEAISHQLEGLGATVAKRFTKDVTHLIFKDGYQSNLIKAEDRKLYAVSPLWIEGCLRVNDRISEAKYPVIPGDKNTSAVVLGKLKRLKSMQPKPIDEDEISRSIERKRKRCNNDIRRRMTEEDTSEGVARDCCEDKVLCPDSDEDSDDGCHSNSDECLVMEKVASNCGSTMTDSCIPSSPEDMFEGGEGVCVDIGGLFDAQVTPGPPMTKETVRPFSLKEKTKNTKESKKKKKKLPLKKKDPSKQGRVRVLRKVTTRLSDCDGSKECVTMVTGSEERVVPVFTAAAKDEDKRSARKRREALKSTKQERNQKRRRGLKPRVPAYVQTRPSLVLTSCSYKDKDVIEAVAKKLGGFSITSTVTMTTTHVVCGAPRRTLNALAGSVRGCWLVSPEWVWKSLEVGEWIEEEPFEMREEFPTAHAIRKVKDDTSWKGLFQPADPIYLAMATPSGPQMRYLIEMGGGEVCGTHRKAGVIIGRVFKDCGVPCVRDEWILDSITKNKILSTDSYLMMAA